MRALVLLLLLLPLAPEAQPVGTQVRYAVDGPESISLGEPLVLDVTATLTEESGYPRLGLKRFRDLEAVTVRRGSASGEIVALEPITIYCGIGVPWVVTGTAYPARTVAHRRVVVHDARLMTPGRYIVEVALDVWANTTQISVRRAVNVVAPEASGERNASEAVAQAIRATTDRRYWDGLTVSLLDVIMRGLAAAEGADVAEDLAALAAVEAASQSVQWGMSNGPDADSVASRHAATALALADRYLARRPAGTYAPEAARARALALAREEKDLEIPYVVATCEGRRYRVVFAPEDAPLRLVGIGTGESVAVPASGEGRGWSAHVVFETTPEAVHLLRGDEILAVAFPDHSTCREDWGILLPPSPEAE